MKLEAGLIKLQDTQRKFLQWVYDNHPSDNNHPSGDNYMIQCVLKRGSYWEIDKSTYNNLRTKHLKEYKTKNNE